MSGYAAVFVVVAVMATLWGVTIFFFFLFFFFFFFFF